MKGWESLRGGARTRGIGNLGGGGFTGVALIIAHPCAETLTENPPACAPMSAWAHKSLTCIELKLAGNSMPHEAESSCVVCARLSSAKVKEPSLRGLA